MKVIGITGGIGAGKSQILTYLKKVSNCRVLEADKVANALKEPGQPCYEPLVALLGREILDEGGRIGRERMAAAIFGRAKLREQVNEIIHPAVKRYILDAIETEKNERVIDYFFIEAALLIEDGYVTICDELWYIYADEAERRRRLSADRGYSREKIDAIMASQLTDGQFRQHCRVVIDNSRTLKEAYVQIEKALEGK